MQRVGRALARLLTEAGIRPPGRRGRAPLHRPAGWIRLGVEDDVLGRIRRVQEYVEVNVGEVRALDDLAEVAGLSRFHFARRFREEVGEPPWAYVRRVRAEEAVRRLRDGQPPADVAYDTGFADQAHLTREMRERYGTTPGRIRREAGEDAGTTDDGVTDADATDDGVTGALRKPVQDEPVEAA